MANEVFDKTCEIIDLQVQNIINSVKIEGNYFKKNNNQGKHNLLVNILFNNLEFNF